MANYDLILVGTGFASTFFLQNYLKHPAHARNRILVLERGRKDNHAWQVQQRKNSSIDPSSAYINNNKDKGWVFNVGFGGGSNCWWAGTPRFMPNDFLLQSQYQVGTDWPITYDDLEPHYDKVEKIMQVSGPDLGDLFPRSHPYPQPPHNFTDPDKQMKQAYPNLYFQQPCARARIATAHRPKCCANGVCGICPINSKFTIASEMAELYEDPRVDLRLEAPAIQVLTQGDLVTGVAYMEGGQLFEAKGDLVILGANALFNPHLMLRSGFTEPALGKGLNEQVSYSIAVDLDGIDNFQGSTSISAHAYHLYDGAHRKQRAACLIESTNVPDLRAERGKWRQRMILRCVMEDLPDSRNYVREYPQDKQLAETVYVGHSQYTQRTIDRLVQDVETIFGVLPIEKIHTPKANHSDAHILGTTMMGDDPQNSVVDRHLIHHRYRNLVVLGSGVFPTCPPANPTLTLSALSSWSAEHLFGK